MEEEPLCVGVRVRDSPRINQSRTAVLWPQISNYVFNRNIWRYNSHKRRLHGRSAGLTGQSLRPGDSRSTVWYQRSQHDDGHGPEKIQERRRDECRSTTKKRQAQFRRWQTQKSGTKFHATNMGLRTAYAGIFYRIVPGQPKPDHLGRKLFRFATNPRDHLLGQSSTVGKLLTMGNGMDLIRPDGPIVPLLIAGGGQHRKENPPHAKTCGSLRLAAFQLCEARVSDNRHTWRQLEHCPCCA